MAPQRAIMALLIFSGVVFLASCTEDSAELKQKVANLENLVQRQDRELREFSAKFAVPKDFSADIARLEDQQERTSQVLKTRVDPVNSKLEEFREWAQEAQKDRDATAKKLKALEQSLADIQKKTEAERAEVARMSKENAANAKTLAGLVKSVESVSKSLTDVRKEVLENNTKMVAAVQKTLPKVRDAAVAELKDRLTPLEAGLASLKAGLEGDKKAIEALRGRPDAPESQRESTALAKRVRDLEEFVAAQKGYLLEVGTKIHSLEKELKQALAQ